VRVAAAADVPRDGGLTISHGALRVAVFHFATRGEWWATQATCPHRKDDVLGRGLLGTHDGTPKVACPLHKKTFSLASGEGLSDARYCIRTYPVEVRNGEVWLKLPPLHTADALPAGAGEEAACARP
jgi:NAD(P)H-dependent nitrite reductase small subunit